MSTLDKLDGTNPPKTTKLRVKVIGMPAIVSFDTLRNIAEFDTLHPKEYDYTLAETLFREANKEETEWSNMLEEFFVNIEGHSYQQRPRAVDYTMLPPYVHGELHPRYPQLFNPSRWVPLLPYINQGPSNLVPSVVFNMRALQESLIGRYIGSPIP
ncbi:hypothetical protein R6Q59_035918 [Mikania micrantha]